jgi:hypothetical protein
VVAVPDIMRKSRVNPTKPAVPGIARRAKPSI